MYLFTSKNYYFNAKYKISSKIKKPPNPESSLLQWLFFMLVKVITLSNFTFFRVNGGGGLGGVRAVEIDRGLPGKGNIASYS